MEVSRALEHVPDLAEGATAADCARAFRVLRELAVQAAWRRSGLAVRDVQRDIVAGARRLERRCLAANAPRYLLDEVTAYRQAAEAALARLDGEREAGP